MGNQNFTCRIQLCGSEQTCAQQSIDKKTILEISNFQSQDQPLENKTIKRQQLQVKLSQSNEDLVKVRKSSNPFTQGIYLQDSDEQQIIFQKSQIQSQDQVQIRSSSLILTPQMFIRKFKDNIFEKYQVIKYLGGGSFGQVNLAINKEDGQIRAIKSIKKIQDKNDKQLKEAEILSQINHPNVLKLFEIFEDQLNFHLVTEYVQGGELLDRLNQQKSFSEQETKYIMRQIFSAVSYCHQKGIVHRDLKLENILFTAQSPCNALKVIDFGTSALKQRKDKKLKTLYGTRYYVAPEVLTGNYDQKCDIWSCGVIMYFLLTGEPPFQGRSSEQVLKRVLKGQYSLHQPVWRKVSQEAKDLIIQILTKNIEMRPSAKQCLKSK